MKRFFLAALIALLAGALVFEQMAAGSGYVLIALGNTAYEMSFWTAAIGLIVLITTIHLVLWLVSNIFAITTGTAGKIAKVGQKSQQQRTARGLIEFIEGNWKQARQLLIKSAKHADTPMINYLAAARSTYELGNEKEAIELLHAAEKSNPDNTLAVVLTQARMYLAAQKYERSMANLKRARELAPHHPVVLDLLHQNYRQLRDWSALLELIPDLRRYKILSESSISELEITVHRALLVQSGQSLNVGTIDQQWDKVPKALRKQSPVLLGYVKQLTVAGQLAKAENCLRKHISQHWDDELVDYYGRIIGPDPKRQLLFAKDWLQSRPANPVLLLCLGRLAMASHQWFDARDYFYASIQLSKNAQSCGEMARLLVALGETTEAAQYFQQALTVGELALPDLPLPDLPPSKPEDINPPPSLRVVKEQS